MQKGGREKSRPVFPARIEILSRRQNPHPSKTAKGWGIPLLKHDLLKQFRTDDFAYLLALFCDLLRLLFATHDLVTHRLAFLRSSRPWQRDSCIGPQEQGPNPAGHCLFL